MIDPTNVPPVDPGEILARFIFSRSHIRADRTVKPDAFMPPPNRELSVTRHRDATEKEIWIAGRAIERLRHRALRGRGDVMTSTFTEAGLGVSVAPVRDVEGLPDNPNHANVTDWPAEKAQQKRLANIIARRAALVDAPHK